MDCIPVHWHTIDRSRGVHLQARYPAILCADTAGYRAHVMTQPWPGVHVDSVTFIPVLPGLPSVALDGGAR